MQESWLYHLTVATGCASVSDVGTDYEQLIARLMTGGDSSAAAAVGSCYWSDPQLLHSKEPLASPLTSLPSELLQADALQLFKVTSSSSTV